MKSFSPFLLFLVLASCTVVNTRGAPVPALNAPPPTIGTTSASSPVGTAVNPPPPAAPSISSSNTTWNSQLGLAAYPNSQLIDLDGSSNGSSKVVFESRASFGDVYAYIHGQLTSKGWQRTALDLKTNATKLEAKYRLGSRNLEVKLDAQGNSGRFKLELNF